MWCNQPLQICTKLCSMASKNTHQTKQTNEQMQMYHNQAQYAVQQQVKAKQRFEEETGCLHHSLQHISSGIPPLPASLHHPYPWPWLYPFGTFCHLFHPCASSPRPHPCPHTDASVAAAAVDPCLALCPCPCLPSYPCHPPARRSGGPNMLGNIELLRCLHADYKHECSSLTMPHRLLQSLGSQRICCHSVVHVSITYCAWLFTCFCPFSWCFGTCRTSAMVANLKKRGTGKSSIAPLAMP